MSPSNGSQLVLRRDQLPALLVLVLIGSGVFAGGWLAARSKIPEWRAAPLASAEAFRQPIDLALDRAGLVSVERDPVDRDPVDRDPVDRDPAAAARSWQLTTNAQLDEETSFDPVDPAWRELGVEAARWLEETRRGPYLRVRLTGASPSGEGGELRLSLTGSAQVVAARYGPESIFSTRVARRDGDELRDRQSEIAALLLAPGETLGEAQSFSHLSLGFVLWPVVGSAPPEVIETSAEPATGTINARRRPGQVDKVQDGIVGLSIGRMLTARLPDGLPVAVVVIGVAILLLTSLHRRRFDARTGLLLAVAGAAAAMPAVFAAAPSSSLELVGHLLRISIGAPATLICWATAESWWRASNSGMTTSLDALRVGRLGPRGGRELLAGWAGGATLAGFGLLFAAAAVPSAAGPLLPDLLPAGPSLTIPLFGERNPVAVGTWWAAVTLLAATASRFVPGRTVSAGAAVVLAAPLLAADLPLHPHRYALLGAALLVALLLGCLRRFGLTAILVAGIVANCLPTAVFALGQPNWLTGTGLAAGGLALLPLLAGIAGARRSDVAEAARELRPAFVRRLEEEQRLSHEMDLLARMQLGLLPANLPQPDGWQLAARSLLATEAGGDLYDVHLTREDPPTLLGGPTTPDAEQYQRLWLACGDVAGHGYSCAIAQAMTKAGLASLIEPNRAPSAVLQRLDRVLRTGSVGRSFTSLALVSIDLTSGEGVLANAGHPNPLVHSPNGTRELAGSAALPLGQGPPRTYLDTPFALAQGESLVLFTDGLFEAVDSRGVAFGLDRLAATTRQSNAVTAEVLLEELLADWRKHLAGQPLDDDTTVVVLRRV